jgi:hypothetical protein
VGNGDVPTKDTKPKPNPNPNPKPKPKPKPTKTKKTKTKTKNQKTKTPTCGTYLVGRKGGRLAALVGGVELLAVDERAAVVAGAGRAGQRAGRPRLARLDDLVLQARVRGRDAVLLEVGREPGLALGRGGRGEPQGHEESQREELHVGAGERDGTKIVRRREGHERREEYRLAKWRGGRWENGYIKRFAEKKIPVPGTVATVLYCRTRVQYCTGYER